MDKYFDFDFEGSDLFDEGEPSTISEAAAEPVAQSPDLGFDPVKMVIYSEILSTKWDKQ